MVDENTDYVRYNYGTTISYNKATDVMEVNNVGRLSVTCGRDVATEADQPVMLKALTIY